MTLNLTFFVQVLNFYIAYKLLERFFVRPALDVIGREDAYTAFQKARIEKVKREIDELLELDSAQRQLFLESCHRHSPGIVKKEVVIHERAQQFFEPHVDDLSQCKDALYHSILKVVSDD